MVEVWKLQGICSSQSQKKTRDYYFDMENEKTPRMEEPESGQQKMQEKISRATKMVINLTKGKGITNDPGEPTSWKGSIDPFIVSNLNNHVEQKELRKNPSERSNHVDMQQRCSLLDKKLKEICRRLILSGLLCLFLFLVF